MTLRHSLRASRFDGLMRWTPSILGGFMGISEFRMQLFSGFLGPSESDQVLPPYFRNFGVCPHCQKKGGPFLLDRLNDEGPIISRSDGESFHLVLGGRPISFPAEKSSGKTEMMTAGFWYVSERESARTPGTTETVVVILRKPPRLGVELTRHLETVADRLADKLANEKELATLYEFYGDELHRVP
jgi:hypothetical protein